MKFKLTAALSALLISIASIPFISACGVTEDYVLHTDGDGNKYYVASCSGYKSSLKGEYEIPEYYGEGEDRAPVTEIAEHGFSGTSLTKITIPKTVTKIGAAAFSYNSYLKEAVFAEGSEIEEIENGMFANCFSLTGVLLPQSVKQVAPLVFYNCSSLEGVALPQVESIGLRAFESCSALKNITLPDTLTTIGALAFYNSGLTEIVIPDSVSDITDGEQTTEAVGYAAFYGCASLETAAVGQGVTAISAGMFGECTSLTKVYLPSGLEEIRGAYAENGTYYFGHAFFATALTDVYYGGTEQQWTALSEKIDNKPVTQNKVTSDNSALFLAERHYGSEYNGR